MLELSPFAALPRPKILIVDDTPANLVAMRRLLARVDAELVTAGSGNEALAACLQQEFALILLDVQMPDMDGFEVATLLLEHQGEQATPIIFVTAAYKDDLARMHGYAVGAVDYIPKPVDEFVLLSKVKVFLDLYRGKQALRQAEALARHQATHDALTDLPNRLLFMERLRSGLERARREDRLLALIYVDIDRFKPVNDQHGHAAGDALLKAIARRLRGLFRAVDTVARLGGDEFAVILQGLTDAREARQLARAIEERIGQSFEIASETTGGMVTVEIGASTGIALYPGDADSLESLIRVADAAMYRHKRDRR
ncbi:MAG TPA: diguanylate cyclase [Solimonas sp.]|nr:diguanylate cyclase [Solimonas sp.]